MTPNLSHPATGNDHSDGECPSCDGSEMVGTGPSHTGQDGGHASRNARNGSVLALCQAMALEQGGKPAAMSAAVWVRRALGLAS